MQELFEAYELDKEENKMAKKHKKKEFTVRTFCYYVQVSLVIRGKYVLQVLDHKLRNRG
jgi:hypothetical protein